MARLEVFFDVSSPWTYLAVSQTPDLATRTGAQLVWRPILVGGVFNKVNQAVYEQRSNPAPAKAAYHIKDLQDWAGLYGLTIKWPSVFPVRAVSAMRGAVVAQGAGKLVEYAMRCFESYWGEDKDISKEDVLKTIAREVGLEPDAFWHDVQDTRIKQALIDNTEELIMRGGFGSPTMFVNGDDMYFGNDRLMLVERALTKVSSA